MILKLYYDLMSQPSRALYILLKTAKCDFTPRPVALREGEHYTDEYKVINRFQRVPVIDHDGFILTESVAIIKYLARQNLVPDNLYPKDTKSQARVDEFLEWQHLGLRLHCAMFFRVKVLEPITSGRASSPETVANYEKRMIMALESFNDLWLGQGNEYISGNFITVADLLAACEIEQPRMAGFDPFEKYSNIKTWCNKVRQHFSPHYEEAHTILNKIVKSQKKTGSKI